jgi:hypothetical protein
MYSRYGRFTLHRMLRHTLHHSPRAIYVLESAKGPNILGKYPDVLALDASRKFSQTIDSLQAVKSTINRKLILNVRILQTAEVQK